MTREAFRRRKQPFYKKKSFLIPIILVLIIIIGLFIIWRTNSSNNSNHDNTEQSTHKIEKVKPKKATKKKKTTKKANKAEKVTKEQPEQKVQKQEEPKQQPAQIKNAGTYNDLVYDTDWYTFKISNEVKLIKDANGDAALMVKYNYTNKTNNNEIPQKVQSNAIMLKQNDQQLSPTTATGDNANLINSTNNGQVLPGKSFDGALLVKVNDTTSEVTMYFKNIQTNAWLDSTQPLKLD
ncbi:hypothetical protein FC88_GL001374 [Companilactobacillus futsaii JCM 17355]|nr:hypothetical protein FC88_GL001374 [Companilactobacillus futsaii JCM 17355]